MTGFATELMICVRKGHTSLTEGGEEAVNFMGYCSFPSCPKKKIPVP